MRRQLARWQGLADVDSPWQQDQCEQPERRSRPADDARLVNEHSVLRLWCGRYECVDLAEKI
jgi:hypothetical protein